MTEQNRPNVKGFFQNVFQQMGKFGFSYIGLIIGMIQKLVKDSFKHLSIARYSQVLHQETTQIYRIPQHCNPEAGIQPGS